MPGPEIRRFYVDGAVKELSHLDAKQAHEELRVKYRMLREGYVPVLDIAPLVETSYDEGKETFRYAITIYGVKVEGDSWDIEGWLNGELITASMQTRFARLSKASGLAS